MEIPELLKEFTIKDLKTIYVNMITPSKGI